MDKNDAIVTSVGIVSALGFLIAMVYLMQGCMASDRQARLECLKAGRLEIECRFDKR